MERAHYRVYWLVGIDAGGDGLLVIDGERIALADPSRWTERQVMLSLLAHQPAYAPSETGQPWEQAG